MPWPAVGGGPTVAPGPITSAASMSPSTVPEVVPGHAGVPAGGAGRLLHRKNEMPPLIAALPEVDV